MQKENNSFEKIWTFLKKCKRVAMTLHYGPDGDSIGSCTALKYVLEKEGIKVDLVSYDVAPVIFNSFKFLNDIKFGTDISDLNPDDYDAFIFLDSGNIYMSYGKLKKAYEDPKNFIINIDHHPTNDFYGNLNYIDDRAPSTCSILLELFKNIGVKFDEELSKRLLIGICTDTGFFKYANANRAINEATFLINRGANYADEIVKPMLYNDSLNLLKYQAYIILRVKLMKNKKTGKVIGYSSVSYNKLKEFGLNSSEIRSGASQLQFVRDIDVAFYLTELEDFIKGSLRCQKGIDVSLIAKSLGGGGHKNAAGFRLKKMPLKDAEDLVLKEVNKFLR